MQIRTFFREYPRREFVGEKNKNFKKLLEENEKNYVDFLINKAESLKQFLESGIKNIRLNPWNAES